MDITGELFEDEFLPHVLQARRVEAKKLRQGAIRDAPLTLQQGAHQVLIQTHHGAVDHTLGHQEALVAPPDQSAPRVIDYLGMRIEELLLEIPQGCVIELELPLQGTI